MSTSKIALVTGANKGIGLETARRLAQEGITVLLGSRNEARGRAAEAQLQGEGLDVTYLALDVANTDDISAVRDYVAATYGKLDILVNNAGVHLEGGWMENSTPTLAPETLRRTFDINFFGLIELTQALLPLIEKSEAGRIVNVSSILGSLTLHATPGSPIYATKPFAYNASKTALNQFTVHLADALKDTNIKVNSAHPGWVKTDMGTDAAPLTVEQGAETSVSLALLEADGPTGQYLHNGDVLPW